MQSFDIGQQFDLPSGYKANTIDLKLGPGFDRARLDSQLNRYFTFQEPWGPDIVTNGSIHRYLDPLNGPDDVSPNITSPFRIFDDAVQIEAALTSNGSWVSGVLSTQHRPDWYVYPDEGYEVELRLPIGQGLWPATWNVPAFTVWPEDYEDMVLPEFDTVEDPNLRPANSYQMASHSYNELLPIKDRSRITASEFIHDCDFPVRGEWHRFGMFRGGEYNYYMLNRKVLHKVPVHAERIMRGPWITMINLAVGGVWPGPPKLDRTRAALGVRKFTLFSIRAINQTQSDPVLGNGNNDLLKDLRKLEANATDHAVRGINAAFDDRRRELGGLALPTTHSLDIPLD